MKIVLDHGAFAPERAHPFDAGMDLRTPTGFSIYAHQSAIVDTGVHADVPEHFMLKIDSKSGLCAKKGIVVEAGIVDCGYTGSIKVCLYNHSDNVVSFKRGDKIAQAILMPISLPSIEIVESLDETERGNGGFGSTGR